MTDEKLALAERILANLDALRQVIQIQQDPEEDEVLRFNGYLRRLLEAGFDVEEWLVPLSLLQPLYGYRDGPDGQLVPLKRVSSRDFVQRFNPAVEYLYSEVARLGREQVDRQSAQVAASDVPQSRDPVIFIGHGHSPLWRELKDYIEDDLHLQTSYFEQDSRVGMHMAEILSGFLDQSTCAVVVLTADDEQADGRERARQNVVHEVGYFQGRLGFRRVAMLIQEGVEEFSNVIGIVPIPFPGRHIKQAFPELQRWLRREGQLPQR